MRAHRMLAGVIALCGVLACTMPVRAQEYNEWANECAQNADAVTKKIFEELVGDEESHYNQFDDEMENLKKFGDNYLALQSIERSKHIGGGGEA